MKYGGNGLEGGIMQKYQEKFKQRLKQQVEMWQPGDTISRDQIYRFLHSVHGTAASIGLPDYSQAASEKLTELNKELKDKWSFEEVMTRYFSPFIKDMTEQAEPLRESSFVPVTTVETIEEQDAKAVVLMIDEDLDFLSGMKSGLEQRGFIVLLAASPEKGLEMFLNERPNCVIVDYVPPYERGYESTQSLLSKATSEFIPVLMISSSMDKDIELSAYKSGVADFIKKPVDSEELEVRMNNRLRYQKVIQQTIMTDELTGVYTRRYLSSVGKKQLSQALRSKQTLTVAMLDLDFFKKVNDTYGHPAGDNVLKSFANIITRLKREYDLLFRLGGEEFLLLLPNTTPAEAKKVVERIRIKLRLTEYQEAGSSFNVTFSSGIAGSTIETKKLEELIEQADQALYMAKQTGRNQTVLFENKNMVASKRTIYVSIIDDDEVLRRILFDRVCELVTDQVNLEVTAYKNGEEFLLADWYKTREKHLVILDRIMPKMDGLEVLSTLRSKYPEHEVMVLMLTGRKQEQEIVKALELGADDYLTKPFKVDEVTARIKRLIKRSLL